MPANLAIIAALPREIATLVRGTKPDDGLLSHGIHLFRLRHVVVVAAGMGASRAALAVEAALSVDAIKTLISTGLAGACSTQLAAGAVVEANEVIDAGTGERFSTACNGSGCLLATSGTIASISEKKRLVSTYSAALVDMEAATVARIARAHGLAFRAIKAISDAHDFELASLSRFSGKHGSFRTGAFAMHTALRPATWTKAATLGRNSNRALASLHLHLRSLIQG